MRQWLATLPGMALSMKNLWTPWRMAYIRGKRDANDNGGCVFCALADGSYDAEVSLVIARSTHCFLTLNRYPYNYGHLMVAPYAHLPSPEDLDIAALTDIASMTNRAMRALRQLANPAGFNLGANIGAAAGAGIAEHYHFHIVPRWEGDANFMATVGDTRVIPDTLDQLSQELRATWSALYGADDRET